MLSQLIDRHDSFINRLLEHEPMAGELHAERTPSGTAGRLILDVLEVVSASFMTGGLEDFYTDRLYRVRLRAGGIAFIHGLFEHGPSSGPRRTLMLLGSMMHIWQWWEKCRGEAREGDQIRLPPILPLVVYHGETEWRMPLNLISRVDLQDGALCSCLQAFQDSLSGFERVEDTSHSPDSGLRPELLRLGQAAAVLGINDLLALVRYILAEPNEVDAELLEDVLREIVPGQETRIMSIAAEQWKAEGIQIGEISGKADLLLRQLRRRFGTLPESTQARVLCASEDQLNEWAETLLGATTLDAVFGAHRTN
jgi:hypothetical protein